MKTLKDLIQNPIGILIIIILLLAGYTIYLNKKLDKGQENLLQIQLNNNQNIISKFNELKTARKDTLMIINNNIIKQEQKKEEVKNEISNINDIDSVITNYYKYRPGNGN